MHFLILLCCILVHWFLTQEIVENVHDMNFTYCTSEVAEAVDISCKTIIDILNNKYKKCFGLTCVVIANGGHYYQHLKQCWASKFLPEQNSDTLLYTVNTQYDEFCSVEDENKVLCVKKIVATVVFGIMDFFENRKIITRQYYSDLLDWFDKILEDMWPHLAKKMVLYHYSIAPAHSSKCQCQIPFKLLYKLLLYSLYYNQWHENWSLCTTTPIAYLTRNPWVLNLYLLSHIVQLPCVLYISYCKSLVLEFNKNCKPLK